MIEFFESIETYHRQCMSESMMEHVTIDACEVNEEI